MKLHLLGIIFCFLVLSGCEAPKNTVVSIDLPFVFKPEISLLDSLNPTVIKSIEGKGSVKTDSINWASELSFFLDFEELYTRNKLEYIKNEFTVNNNSSKAYEYDVIEFTTSNKKLKVNKAIYKLVNGECVKIIFHRSIKNVLITQNQVLEYEPKIRYSITGEQEVGNSNELNYELKGLFLPKDMWRAMLNIGEDVLPFNFSLDEDKAIIYNAEERIAVNSITRKGDSLFIDLPYFNSEIKAKFYQNTIVGNWHNYAKGDYTIPFHAIKSNARFDYNKDVNSVNIDGKWEVIFSPGDEDQYPAIGVFKQDGNYLTGTFITETGDYRYLEGYIEGNNLKLSCFDGAHAFLFSGTINDNGEIHGKFHSGKHWTEKWTATKNASVQLQDPYTLTELTTPDSVLNFSFPNLDSVIVSLESDKYLNKPVIVQIMGSWCPNCMDESKLLIEFYENYNPQGLEVIALCFEPFKEFSKNKRAVGKIKSDLKIPYEMLIAGRASKKEAAKALPMLNQIISYPTTIYLDKDHKIQRIHTGFYGPGTGPYYDSFVTETTTFIKELLN